MTEKYELVQKICATPGCGNTWRATSVSSNQSCSRYCEFKLTGEKYDYTKQWNQTPASAPRGRKKNEPLHRRIKELTLQNTSVTQMVLILHNEWFRKASGDSYSSNDIYNLRSKIRKAMGLTAPTRERKKKVTEEIEMKEGSIDENVDEGEAIQEPDDIVGETLPPVKRRRRRRRSAIVATEQHEPDEEAPSITLPETALAILRDGALSNDRKVAMLEMYAGI